MQTKRVEESSGSHDPYNPLPVSISYDSKDLQSCNVFMRRENHTMGNLLKHHLLQDPTLEFVGCGMVHPPDIRILQLKLRHTEPGGEVEPALLGALRRIRGQAAALRTELAAALRR